MSIVQRIVDRLHGQLGVESTPGKGSTFWFALAAPEG
jgi:signal transduction histidine kinase